MELLIVYWNLNNIAEADISFHLNSANPMPENLSRRNGMSFNIFIKNLGLDQDKVWGCFSQQPTQEVKGTRDFSLEQILPVDIDGMKKLAKLINMPISVYRYIRESTRLAEFYFRVE
jgi:hypothetical protein